MRFLQTICEGGITLPVEHASGGKADGLGWPNQDRKLLGSGQSGVQKIPTQQQVMLHEERQKHHRVLTALTFVDGHGPCKREF